MIHHDSRDYDEAASAAAKKGREKMEEIIHNGLASAEAVIENIRDKIIADRVVPARRVHLYPHDEGGYRLSLGVAGDEFGATTHDLHPHAFGQILQDAGVGGKYRDHIMKEAGNHEWGPRLIADNVNTILSHRAKQRNLVRMEGQDETVKGFLSDKFRRLDSRPLVEAFVDECQALGLMPIEGILCETKCRIRAVLPKVFEPRDNEVMIFGAELGNSNFGDGGLTLNLWTMRVWCTNLAIAEKCLRQIHLGGRLPDDLELSAVTYQKDTETMASALRDVTRGAIAPARVNRMLEAVRMASDEQIRGRDGIDKILGKALSKPELDRVGHLFESDDVVNLPAGDNLWRLSNAVSWLAQARDVSRDRKLDLQQLAGQIIADQDAEVLEA